MLQSAGDPRGTLLYNDNGESFQLTDECRLLLVFVVCRGGRLCGLWSIHTVASCTPFEIEKVAPALEAHLFTQIEIDRVSD
jgi:hypothetical protein